MPGPLPGALLALLGEEATMGRRPWAGPQQLCRLLYLQTEAHPLAHFSQRPPCRGRTGLPGRGGGTGAPGRSRRPGLALAGTSQC